MTAMMTQTTKQAVVLIVLTPGLSESRLLYSALARSLASTTGLPVVTVDHPFEAQPGVEFPDGSVVPGLNVSGGDEAALSRLVKVRADDISFLLHNIATLLAHLPSPLRQHLLHIHHHLGHHSPPRALIIGHSLGGSAAAALLLSDPSRAVAAINLDGRVVFPAASVAPLSSSSVPVPVRDTNEQKKQQRGVRSKEKRIKKEASKNKDSRESKEKEKRKGRGKRPGPLVQLGRPNHRAEDPTWNATWPILNGGGGNINSSSCAGGPVVELSVAGTAHAAFTDRPLLLLAAGSGLSDAQRGVAAQLVGTMGARRLEEVLGCEE
ncbi:hypothetical protein PLIIFM63780_009797 [Purpureocillium lilacinum]|nr:hypothetical protein PLIIFM63780_009797 [Purpureocillium lilacinum]